MCKDKEQPMHAHSHGDKEHAHPHGDKEHAHLHGDKEHAHLHGDKEHAHPHGDKEHTHSHAGEEHAHGENGHCHHHGKQAGACGCGCSGESVEKKEEEILGILLDHWAAHNKDHAMEYNTWVEKMNRLGKTEVAEDLIEAIALIAEADKHLVQAKVALLKV